ncbi:MAG: sigma 54-interacting transcriptional regulator [Syntrophales bacterium]|jgi:PAS domain S-box-containing protein|nr:sigma 54-interacting transcriptional regulator [Syntrophales bacterium]
MFSNHLGQYWETIVNTMTDGVIVVDVDCKILTSNRALEEMTGYDKKELVGQPCTILGCDVCVSDRSNAAGKKELNCDLFSKGTVVKRRCQLRRKNGKTLHMLKNAAILKDGSGKTVGGVETITDITDLVEKEEVIRELKHLLLPQEGFEGIIGKSGKMADVFELIRNAAASDAPIIIYGESGTGKELAVNAIHRLGERNKRPLIKVSCAALSESLLESELFGHVKGAFTGAGRDRKGRFEAAHRGDLFLDEIGDIPLTMQIKLLRALQEKEIERVGEQTPIRVDVRIIAATHRDLRAMCREGGFRDDLFYRLNVIPINLPPLRERPEDIPLLVDYFIRTIRMRTGKDIQGVTEQAMGLLIASQWPGNIRELINVLEYAFVVCREELISAHHLPSLHPVGMRLPCRPQKGEGGRTRKEELLRILENTGGNRQEAARLLGISRVTLWKLLKRHAISIEPLIRSEPIHL